MMTLRDWFMTSVRILVKFHKATRITSRIGPALKWKICAERCGSGKSWQAYILFSNHGFARRPDLALIYKELN